MSDTYSVFTDHFDQEIHAKALEISSRFSGEPVRTADETWRAVQCGWGSELALLQAQATVLSGKLSTCISLPKDASLTILVDHSGSMRGDNIQLAALLCELSAQVAVKLSLPYQILGFTTVEWKGTPVREFWISQGQPEMPGRLCALNHIIYSDFDDTDKSNSLRAMFLPDLLKENVDGEALLWAVKRAKDQSSGPHLVVVISDGAPVDDSTLEANTPSYLWDHLKEMVGELNQDASVILAGMGINHDVGDLYKTSGKIAVLQDVEDIALPLLESCLTQLAARPSQ
ncbi:MAG: cobaltochelatase CobT-related protein [Pelagimonas sp.]|uniref:cobaltochelatase CobT-related protein n=1 Tax=Pelagimonas sp. TaxID=2073170 RepID=UPI003D6A01F2